MPSEIVHRAAPCRNVPVTFTLGLTVQRFYVYMLHEDPIERPFNCKIGVTGNPQRRLRQLQAGNPRRLRTWLQSRRPMGNFGLALPTKMLACELEQQLLQKLEDMGVRLRQDLNYERNSAEVREWVQEIHPKDLWNWMVKEYMAFLKRNELRLLSDGSFAPAADSMDASARET